MILVELRVIAIGLCNGDDELYFVRKNWIATTIEEELE